MSEHFSSTHQAGWHQLLTKRGFDAPFSEVFIQLVRKGQKGVEVTLVPGEQQSLQRILQEVPLHKDKTESGEFVEL